MTAIRLLLNSGFTGANAFFAIADARGLFRDAGLDVAFTPGRGAYTAAARLAAEGYDAAYGDLNALIELAAGAEAALPIAVFMAHEHAPSTITVAADSPIRAPADLVGRKIIGHGTDVALRTFPAFARAARLAADSVVIEARDAGMTALLDTMLAGEADGVFGYMTTHAAAQRPAAPPIRFLRYRDSCPVLYGSALMASPRLLRDQPDAVAGLVDGMRRGIAAAAAEPEAAIDAVIQRNPSGDRRIELERWRGTLHDDMGCAAGLRARLGDVEAPRLEASIRCLAEANGWSRTPSAHRIFTRRFLAAP